MSTLTELIDTYFTNAEIEEADRKNRTDLNPKFQTGQIPEEKDFFGLIYNMISLKEDGIFKDANNPLCIKAKNTEDPNDPEDLDVLLLYNNEESTPAWRLNIKDGLRISSEEQNNLVIISNPTAIRSNQINVPVSVLRISNINTSEDIPLAQNTSGLSVAVSSDTDESKNAIIGTAYGNSGIKEGIKGIANGDGRNNIGVYGIANGGAGIGGINETNPSSGELNIDEQTNYGGIFEAIGGNDNYGIVALSRGPSANTAGYFISDQNLGQVPFSSIGIHVEASNSSIQGTTTAVWARASNSANNIGRMYGVRSEVSRETDGFGMYAIYGEAPTDYANSHAGYFVGNVTLEGGWIKITERAANDNRAHAMLDSLENNELIIGGCWNNNVYFYWKNNNGTKLRARIEGTAFQPS